jgi:hypothetical protein
MHSRGVSSQKRLSSAREARVSESFRTNLLYRTQRANILAS